MSKQNRIERLERRAAKKAFRETGSYDTYHSTGNEKVDAKIQKIEGKINKLKNKSAAFYKTGNSPAFNLGPGDKRKTVTHGGKLKKGDPYVVNDFVQEGGTNPPDTLNLKGFNQKKWHKNPGKPYEKGQYVDEDVFDDVSIPGFNADSTSEVKIFKGK